MKQQLKETSSSNDSLESQAIGGEWYFYDSNKGKWGGYRAGQWVQMELATKLSNKKLDTRSIGKLSFTALGGNDAEDYKIAEDTAKKICESVNNYNALKQSNKELIEAITIFTKNNWGNPDITHFNQLQVALQKAKQL